MSLDNQDTATEEDVVAEEEATTTNDFYTVAASKQARWEDDVSSKQDDIDDGIKSITALKAQLREIDGKKLGERVEFGQKLLGLGGQAIAGLTMHPTAQQGLKAVGLIAQLLTATSMTFIGAAFASSARKSAVETHTATRDKAIHDVRETTTARDTLVAGGPA